MIAGKGAEFPAEGHSLRTPATCAVRCGGPPPIWAAPPSRTKSARAVLDDHLALLNAGIPAIDIIDFSYRHWHRLSDTPENCVAEPMAEVAKVLSTWMQRVK